MRAAASTLHCRLSRRSSLAPNKRSSRNQTASRPREFSSLKTIERRHTLLETQLVSAGYGSRCAPEPQRAVEMAAELQPAAVTMDIIMKPINGWQILTALKSDPRTAQIPVIVVTIVDQPSTGALLGADEYIVKPVEKAGSIIRRGPLLERSRRARTQNQSWSWKIIRPRASLLPSLSCSADTSWTSRPMEQRLARESPEGLPELVILDLILPDVSGFELLAEWRGNSSTADLPVFVLTSKDLTPRKENYLQRK